MNKDQLKKEFDRFVDSGFKSANVKYKYSPCWCVMVKTEIPWYEEGVTIVVCDEYSSLRTKLHDDKSAKLYMSFEHIDCDGSRSIVWGELNRDTVDWSEPPERYKVVSNSWLNDQKLVGKVILVRNNDSDEWRVDIFKEYNGKLSHPVVCNFTNWKYAKPMTEDYIYKGWKDGK